MRRNPILNLLLHLIPKISEHLDILLMNLIRRFLPSCNPIIQRNMLQLRKHINEIRTWSAKRRESPKNAINFTNLITIPYQSTFESGGRTNRYTMTIRNLHHDTCTESSIVHIKILWRIKEIIRKLLGLKLLNRRIRFRHTRRQQLPSTSKTYTKPERKYSM